MKTMNCLHCNKSFEYAIEPRKGKRKYCSRKCANIALHPDPNMEDRECPQCKKVFSCKRYDEHKYCSPECGKKGKTSNQKKQYPIKTCVACGKEFEYRVKENAGKYCSRKCSDNTNKSAHRRLPRIPKVCPFCGKEFECAPYHETECCSRICAGRQKAKTQNGENHPLYKPKIEMKCEVCGKVCQVKPSLVSRFRSCSKKCNAFLAQIVFPRFSSIEIAMMKALQERNLAPHHQFSIAPYVIDIAFPDQMLVIECDGDYWHASPQQRAKDHAKDSFLTKRGWQVLRLKECEIKASTDDCVDRVVALLGGQLP